MLCCYGNLGSHSAERYSSGASHPRADEDTNGPGEHGMGRGEH